MKNLIEKKEGKGDLRLHTEKGRVKEGPSEGIRITWKKESVKKA